MYKGEAEVLRPVSSQSLGYILNASGILVSVWLSDLQVNVNLFCDHHLIRIEVQIEFN